MKIVYELAVLDIFSVISVMNLVFIPLLRNSLNAFFIGSVVTITDGNV